MSVRLSCMIESLGELGLQRGALVLDAGCGPGRMLNAVHERGWRAVGVDTSLAMLSLSARRLDGKNPRLASATVDRLPFPGDTFDAVCTAGVFEYLPEDRTGLMELVRVLKPGGGLIFPITSLWSPVGYLDFAVEALKRSPWLLDRFNRLWTRRGRTPVRPRHFRVRRQRPGATRTLLRSLGLDVIHERYFHFLPLPHPFDRLMPDFSARLGERMERLATTPLAGLAEGWLAVCKKPARPNQRREA